MNGCPGHSFCFDFKGYDPDKKIASVIGPGEDNICYPPGKAPEGVKLDDYNTCTGYCDDGD